MSKLEHWSFRTLRERIQSLFYERTTIYTGPDNQTEISVLFEDETVWLNRHQISGLFDRDIKTIGKHIKNVFADGELEEDSVVAKFATTANDGKVYQVEHYNLDIIISVGYRVKSVRGTQFRQWATLSKLITYPDSSRGFFQ